MSLASSYSNPFAGPDPATIRLINIRDRVPVTLDATTSSYNPWKTYFTLLFREENLLDHVDGSIDSRVMAADPEWTSIDATLIRWFFTTISRDLFLTIIREGDNAAAVWTKLNGFFTDNKLQRRVFLHQEFMDCHQDDQTIDEYTRRLKQLADELRDIGAPIDDDFILSTLTANLHEYFGNAASNLTLMPDPSFPKFVSYLKLEEHRMKGVKKRAQHHALAAGIFRGAPPTAPVPAPLPPLNRSRAVVAATGVAAASSRSSRSRRPLGAARLPARCSPPLPGRTAYFAGPTASPHGASYPAFGATPPAASYPSYYAPPPVAVPPAMYPPQVPPPWDPALLAALHSAPSPANYGSGGDYFMDTGATAHMTNHPVKSLVSVRQLTRENPISVKFDAAGFSVKDARTRTVLHRCDSPTDELYPMHPSSIAAPRPAALATSVDLWHARLGHPNATTDNGKEFDNAAVRHLLASHGTVFRLTCPYTSQQNGRAERVIRTLNDCVPPHGSVGTLAAPAPPAAPAAPAPPLTPAAPASPAAPAAPAPLAAPAAPAPPAAPAAPAPHAAAPLDGVLTRARTGTSRPNPRYTDPAYAYATSTSVPSPLPSSARAALHDPHWLAAMREEFDALQRNRTWQLVPRPPHANVISGKWVFRHKTHPDGSLERHKARWVVRGFHQRAGVDFTDTFARLSNWARFTPFFSLRPLELGRFTSSMCPMHSCTGISLSKCSISSLLAPRAWYQRMAGFLQQQGFQSTRSDASLFVYHQGAATAYLLLYVDDIIPTASSTALLQQITAQLSAEFALKDLGALHYFLGIEVVRTATGFFLHQQKYAHDQLERAGMLNCKPASTPVDTKAKVSAVEGSPVSDAAFYRFVVGGLQYLTLTRPYLQYVVQQVCLHMHAPRDTHWALVKRILRYIRGTMSMGLTLTASSDTSLVAYSDADWAGCPDTRHSTSGYCVYLGPSLILWSSKRQPTVSRSSAEAEYRAVANAVAECSWLQQLLQELHCPVPKATIAYCDNVSTVYLSANPVHHRRTKHIELDIHFVREHVALGRVRVLHVPTDQQFSDVMTKGLPTSTFESFRSSLCVTGAASTAGGC
ncbi:uncharacterized protein [Lolium perenne]|uniref:uncharacterized protein n=1 Tax=Lolium perenne TaxID=4522 RepID=UPI003A9A2E4E